MLASKLLGKISWRRANDVLVNTADGDICDHRIAWPPLRRRGHNVYRPTKLYRLPDGGRRVERPPRNPKIRFRTYHGWTIADDLAENTVWSFTYASHPAHPSAVKRQTVEENGIISIKMDVLCQATKPACDGLVAEFEALNEKIKAHLKSESEKRARLKQQAARAGDQYTPSESQQSAAKTAKERYFGFIDSKDFSSAYDMNRLSLQAMIDREAFSALQQKKFDRYGDVLGRTELVTRWIKNPAEASHPGVYVVFIMRCYYNEGPECAEVLTLHEQPDGAFRVVRHEQNFGLKR